MPRILTIVFIYTLLLFPNFLQLAYGGESPAVGTAPDLAIDRIKADKVLYRPGETGVLRVGVKNNSAEPRSAQLEVVFVRELDDRTAPVTRKVDLAGHETKAVDIPFTAGPHQFGWEARAALRADPQGPAGSSASTFFSVAANFFDVGIGGTTSPIFSDNPAKLTKMLANARKNYCNWFDVFFWAPCDFSLLISPLDKWWSGQTSYPHVEANLKTFIADCHANGVSLAAYASCNPAGPFGWELARQHPQWFTDSAGQLPGLEPGDIEALDHWNDPAWRTNHKFSKWLRLNIDLRRLDALDWGIDQLAQSARHYGWDAVRFDGHYTIPGNDEISTRNMRRLKETVWKQVPNFRFAFNYGRAPEWRGGVTHEMREAMAGGGMYMQEGIRNFRYTGATYTSWQHYAINELRIARQIQTLGGSYHCIWGITQSSPREQSAYKLIYGLIAGGHPAYGDHMFAPGCDNWGAFITRWSAFLWDRAIRVVTEPQRQLSVRASAPLIWQPLVQERVESATRRYLIVHLVNPSPNDDIAKTTYQPVKNVVVRFKPAPSQQVRRIVLVRPDQQSFDTELKPTVIGDEIEVTVDELKLWGMVIVELSGKYEIPATAPRFTEPPDDAKVAAATAGPAARIVDPSKPVQVELPAGERVWPTDHGFSGVGGRIESDDQAMNGAAQAQSWDNQIQGNSRRFMGQTFLGPLAAGKYRICFHVKWSDGNNNARWKASVYVRLPDKKKERLAAAEMASPNCWEPPAEGADKFLGADWRQSRHKFGPPDQYHDLVMEFDLKTAGYLHANMIVETDRQGPARFFLDHIRTTLIEPHSDADQAKWSPVEKPAGLRTPAGDKPQKMLVIKGLYSERYHIAKVCTADEACLLPEKYETLYAYDAVILADVDMTSSTFAQRRMLKDFIEDGGRAVILGGIATLGQGGMKNSYLEDLSPVVLKGPREVVADATPALIGFTPGHAAADHPGVFWHHDVKFRPDAQIIAYAGDHPIAARRPAGKGQVVVFTGTVLGAGQDGAAGFWETMTWNELLGKLIRGN